MMKFRLRPNEEKFYDLFEASAELVCKSAKILEEIMVSPESLPDRIEELTVVEHEADDVTSNIIDRINKNLITPMDREDIYAIAQGLDDIIDVVQGSADRMQLYRAGRPSGGARELVRLLAVSTGEIRKCFTLLRNMRGNKDDILQAVSRINQLESDGDKVYRQEVARLFEEEGNPIAVIKWKEILEHLEESLDLCEDMGDFLKGAMLKYT